MPGRIGFGINLGGAREPGEASRRSSERFRMLVMADFSGRRNRDIESIADLGERPCLAVDIDSFDAVFKRLCPALALRALADEALVEFETLDDFHPEQLYASLEPFSQLRASRARLLDPASFEQEAARLTQNQAPTAADSATAAGAATAPATATGGPAVEGRASLLERLIGAPMEHAARAQHAPSSQAVVDNLVRKLVQPHIQPAATQSAGPYVAAVDASLTDLMRAVLHDPDFQELESTWRGVQRLVDVLELGEELQLLVVDISKEELLADIVAAQGNPQDSALYRLLTAGGRRGADAQPWSLLVGHYTFDADADDLALLTHLGIVASQAGAPFIAGGHPRLAGCNSLSAVTEPRQWAFEDTEVEKRWNALRRSAVARWVGLAMPRMLLRLPYGARTERIESFAFEEFTAGSNDHDAYLWGNPALACAQVISALMLEEGQHASISGPHDIADLPAHVRDQDGEKQLQACAEFLLPLHVGEALLQRGVIPLLSYANRNAVRVLGLQSIAEPARALAGFD
jgi:type VI secretion system protein ImpC